MLCSAYSNNKIIFLGQLYYRMFRYNKLEKRLDKYSILLNSLFPRAGEPVSEPGVFDSLELEPLKKKQEPEPLEKNSGAGAAKN